MAIGAPGATQPPGSGNKLDVRAHERVGHERAAISREERGTLGRGSGSDQGIVRRSAMNARCGKPREEETLGSSRQSDPAILEPVVEKEERRGRMHATGLGHLRQRRIGLDGCVRHDAGARPGKGVEGRLVALVPR